MRRNRVVIISLETVVSRRRSLLPDELPLLHDLFLCPRRDWQRLELPVCFLEEKEDPILGSNVRRGQASSVEVRPSDNPKAHARAHERMTAT